MDNNQNISSAEEENEQINQFYTLIFMSNPMSRHVKIWITSNDITLYMKNDKFIELMKKLVSPDLGPAIEQATKEYGGFYFIDREQKTLQSLSLTSEKGCLTPKELLEKSLENKKEKSVIENIFDKYVPAHQRIIKPKNNHKDISARRFFKGFGR